MANNFHHIPVLLSESLDALNVSEGKKYIDATLGGGGHTREIIKHGGMVLGLDQDQDAIKHVQEDQSVNIKNQKLTLVKGNFADIKKIALENGFEKVDGILFDLGVSSYQIDSSGRGFSFKKDERLDMRMDTGLRLTAFDVVNSYSFEKLVDIFYRYAEEHNAKGIAQAIVDRRKKGKITTTKELASIIERIPHKNEDIHPATRVFQAIRIEVNSELEVLKTALQDSFELLNSKGRIVVISFHSLEDRITKQMFEKFKREEKGFVVTKKPLIAHPDEIIRNRRARSAKLRVFEKS